MALSILESWLALPISCQVFTNTWSLSSTWGFFKSSCGLGRIYSPYCWSSCWNFPRSITCFRSVLVSSLENKSKLRMDVQHHKSVHFINNSGHLGAAHTLMRLMGSIWIHLLCVSWHSLARALLRVWLALSTFPKTWGHQDEWKWYLIPKHAAQFWDIVAINEDPLSLEVIEAAQT